MVKDYSTSGDGKKGVMIMSAETTNSFMRPQHSGEKVLEVKTQTIEDDHLNESMSLKSPLTV